MHTHFRSRFGSTQTLSPHLQLIVLSTRADDSQKAWEQAVSDGVREVNCKLKAGAAGFHTLKFTMVDPAMLEKLVLSKDAPLVSYLGPPESYRGAVHLRYGASKQLVILKKARRQQCPNE